MKLGGDKYEKLNDKQMNKVRDKIERAHALLSDSLALIQEVPCLKSDDVVIISKSIDNLKDARIKLEKSYKAKLRPEDWNDGDK